MKNWVAEGIASDLNDFSVHAKVIEFGVFIINQPSLTEVQTTADCSR